MKKVYTIKAHTISAIGNDLEENLHSLDTGETGLKIVNDTAFSPTPLPLGQIDWEFVNKEIEAQAELPKLTRFEKILWLSIYKVLQGSGISLSDPDTILIISTTKGNIDLLGNNPENFPEDRIHLWKSAEIIQNIFQCPNKPKVISNACISGVLGMVQGMRLLRAGKYKHAVVCGADVISRFIVSGFQSFQSLSPEPCKPFDQNRDGLSIGEAAASIILSVDKEKCNGQALELVNGSSSNDANHISGPSREGEGLYLTIKKTLQGFKDIGYISAHGTATPYNDDMESKGITRNGLEHIPVNSFKGYIGHTLGAAGLIESIYGIHSLNTGVIYGTAGLKDYGTVEKINVVKEKKQEKFNAFLKVASGFSGCNASVLFQKNES